MQALRSTLRQELRKRRQALSKAQQAKAAKGLCDAFTKHLKLIDDQHIALYLANDGEIDPVYVQKYLWQINKKCYLPVISKNNKHEMTFIHYGPDTQLEPNRFGILEPVFDRANEMAIERLDAVFLPLTGFDLFGGRLGMGGGFYDRAFSNNQTKAKLIGFAHECQKVEKIPLEKWDVSIDGVLTDKNFYPFVQD